MRGRRFLFFFYLFVVIIIGAVALLPTIIIGNLVDHVLYQTGQFTWLETILRITADTSRNDRLIRYVLAVAIVSVFSTGIRYMVHYGLHQISVNTGAKVRLALYDKLQTLSAGFYSKMPSGELIANLTSDVSLIESLIRDQSYNWIKSISLFIFTLYMLFYYNSTLTLILTVFLPVIAVLSAIIYRYTRFLHRRLRDKFSDMNTYVNENLGAYRVVKAFAISVSMTSCISLVCP